MVSGVEAEMSVDSWLVRVVTPETPKGAVGGIFLNKCPRREPRLQVEPKAAEATIT